MGNWSRNDRKNINSFLPDMYRESRGEFIKLVLDRLDNFILSNEEFEFVNFKVREGVRSSEICLVFQMHENRSVSISYTTEEIFDRLTREKKINDILNG